MTMEIPKYSRWEHERKFLVRREAFERFSGKPYTLIEDKYLESGRLRLRAMTDHPSGKKRFKFAKKFEWPSSYSAPMVNIYLSEIEHASLNVLTGRELKKHRYYEKVKDHVFGVDFFLGELSELAMCEVECLTEADLMKVAKPDFAVCEVTEDLFFTGGHLCKVKAAELHQGLKALLGH